MRSSFDSSRASGNFRVRGDFVALIAPRGQTVVPQRQRNRLLRPARLRGQANNQPAWPATRTRCHEGCTATAAERGEANARSALRVPRCGLNAPRIGINELPRLHRLPRDRATWSRGGVPHGQRCSTHEPGVVQHESAPCTSGSRIDHSQSRIDRHAPARPPPRTRHHAEMSNATHLEIRPLHCPVTASRHERPMHRAQADKEPHRTANDAHPISDDGAVA